MCVGCRKYLRDTFALMEDFIIARRILQLVRHEDMARRLWDAQEVTRDSHGAQGRVFAALRNIFEVLMHACGV